MTVVIDARWLNHTGVGRLAGVLLTGLRALGPEGGWVLWGPPEVEHYKWPGARVAVTPHSPLAWAAQRDLLSVPQGDLLLALHAVRPLTLWRRAAVLLHDVIPAFHGPSASRRAMWRAFFWSSARSAWRLLVYSEATARRATVDLGVPPSRIRRLTLAVDGQLAQRIRQERERAGPPGPMLLYVGQVKPHKNLERSILGFARSRFASTGGSFTLVGGLPDGVERLRAFGREHGIANVTVLPRCSEEELVAAYARAAAVIQPSLEEGFGLPILEARAAGIPVCCSDIPAHREASEGDATFFDPRSVSSIAAAIDSAVVSAPPRPPRLATEREFAVSLLAALDLVSG